MVEILIADYKLIALYTLANKKYFFTKLFRLM